jgi:4-hydroxy-tetrahydrodipicolinate reductase
MKKIVVSGCGGRLGSAIVQRIARRDDCTVIAGVDIAAETVSARYDFPVYPSVDRLAETADVIIDCSHHTAVIPLLAYCTAKHIPAVIATTGHTEEEITAIREASARIPVLYSRNMSLGINLLLDLVQRAAAILGEEYDVEIVEAHHNKKLDAPSGTALMLADAIRDVREESEYVYDRHSVRRERGAQEIGVHSVRGGTIVGEHEVIFAGTDEVIRISHSAYSRDVFATGAVRAALFAADAAPGMYSMKEMLAAEQAE